MNSASEPILLWPGGAPDARGTAPEDTPQLTPYFPDKEKATGAAMVICPGGGYGHLAAHEGEDYALFLNTLGIAAFVLQYRLGPHGYRHPAMLNDASRAMRLVRSRAEEWKLDPHRIGIMGSSAGGHLASTLLTHFDDGDRNSSDVVERESSRPDIGVLCYAVISMGEHAHEGSKRNLLGENPPSDLVHHLSNELHVTPQTPPCFIWHTWEDKGVKLENCLQFAEALNRNDVPFDFHVYQQGRHGIGLADKPPFENAHPWSRDLAFWLKAQGFVN
jgi:acetyl esterase/lipase